MCDIMEEPQVDATLNVNGVEATNSNNIFFKPHVKKMMKWKQSPTPFMEDDILSLLEKEQGISIGV